MLLGLAAGLLVLLLTERLGHSMRLGWGALLSVFLLALYEPVVAHEDLPFSGRLPGHWKHDAAEVLRRQPDYVLFGNVDVTPAPASLESPPDRRHRRSPARHPDSRP